jgi:galactokinase
MDHDVAHALELAGFHAADASARAARFARALAEMRRERGPERADHDERWNAWFVPGRIEVLGKHTDYGGGRSLICAAERGFHVVAAPRSDRRVALTDIGRGTSLTFGLTLGLALDPDAPAPTATWATYPLTVSRRLTRNFPSLTRGADIVFDSDLPSAAGMSSSSALMIAVLLALVRVNRLDETAEWTRNIHDMREDLAAYAATVENGSTFRALTGEAGVGTHGGSEDHTAILCSAPSRIAQYAFCPPRRERSIALAPSLTFAIGVSGIAARKTGEAKGDYNRASRNAARVLERWHTATGRADDSLAAAAASSSDAPQRIRSLLRDDPDLLDRFDQFFEESTELVPAAADQLERGDLDELGRTVARSQELAETRLRNQVPETVALVHGARAHGAWAASAFGAGFGGSVWALVEQAEATAFLDRWQNAYRSACPAAADRAKFFVTRPGPAVVKVSV